MGYWNSENVINIFSSNKKLSEVLPTRQGMATGNNDFFLKLWFEINNNEFSFSADSLEEFHSTYLKYAPYNKGGEFRKWYGNYLNVIRFDIDNFEVLAKQGNHCPSRHLYFKQALTWTLLVSNTFGVRIQKNHVFDVNGMCAFPSNDLYEYISGFMCSKVSYRLLQTLNPTLAFQKGNVDDLPIIIKNNGDIRSFVTDNISLSKLDWDAHETSWDFQGNELIRLVNKHRSETGANNYPIEAVMMVYQAEWNDKFKQLHRNEEELNRRFIEIYGLQDELTPDVPLDEVTILQKGEIDIVDGEIVWNEGIIIKQLISYLVGCFMGRYSIDKPGLIIASQNQDLSALGVKVEGIDNGATGRIEIDDDGVVPILAGEYFPDDMTVRIEQAIKLIFGEEHFQDNRSYINEKLGKPLREYLFKDFFNDHIDGKMYQKRPIYWMFSSKMGDKRKKGYFKALVYMHRMESDTLSKLHADYVVPYIDKIEQQHIEAEDLSLRDDISQAARNKARKSAEEYADQIRELKDFEQVLVQMASQRLSIDLDDGVRVNYPKFYPLVEPIKGLDKE